MSSGPTDYLLFIDRRAVGVIEAKPEAQPSAVSLNKPRNISEEFHQASHAIENLCPLAMKAQVLRPFSGIYAIQTPAPALFSPFINRKSC